VETDRNWNEVRSLEGEGGKREVRKTAQQAKEQVRSFADVRREQLAGHVGNVARAFRTAGERLRAEDQPDAGYYTQLIGEKAERISDYLSEHDAASLIDEAQRAARNNPLVFLGGCVAVGFAIGRFFKASPMRREMPMGVADEPLSSTYAQPTYTPTYQQPMYAQPEPSAVTSEVTKVGGNGHPGQEG
jgi:hypothetical protein